MSPALLQLDCFVIRFSQETYRFCRSLARELSTGRLRGNPLLYIMFILVVSSVLIGFGVLVTALMCRIWGMEQGEAHVFSGNRPVKESPISKAA